MSAYLKLQNASAEFNAIQREATKFTQLYNSKLKGLDLSKVELNNPDEVRSTLSELKTEAKDLVKLLESMFSGIHNYAKSHKERDSYVHGRYGQLKGEADKILDRLRPIINDLTVLEGAAAEANQSAVALKAFSEVLSENKQVKKMLTGEVQQETPYQAPETVQHFMEVFALAAMLIILFKEFKRRLN
jgi:transcriptional regulator of heat shock response